ncbi:MAG: polymer-forming cytoskeletal protein [bacterium]
MLMKRKDNDNGNPAELHANVVEAKFASDQTPAAKENRTVIGEQISVEGNIRGKENLLIEGRLKGSIELEEHQVIIGMKGVVEGEVIAKDVTVSGRMTGNVKALGRVEITRQAEFHGELKARRISVEDGAYIKASIELEREPEAKSRTIGPAGVEPKAADREPVALAVGAHGSK